MPTYVYQCPAHPTTEHRKEVVHSVNDQLAVLCDECQGVMHRIPQPFRWYMDPRAVLVDYMDGKYRDYRARKKKEKRHAKNKGRVRARNSRASGNH